MIRRGFSAFLGTFVLLNLLGNVLSAGFDCNLWWIDLHMLPVWMGWGLLLALGVVLLVHAAAPGRLRKWRWGSAGLIGVVALFALGNAIQFYVLVGRSRITSFVMFPFSLLICAGLGAVAVQIVRPAGADERFKPRVFFGAVAASIVLFPLLQILFFGTTDYRRPADVVVVFGARAYADGTPSLALSDRVETACNLYRQGLVRRLIFSGGPGDGAASEPQVMRETAMKLGVPGDAITLDEIGLNTEATVRNTLPLFRQMGVTRVLAVSHGYHLPRVKMAYARAGVEVFTVPAHETRRLRDEPKLICREVVAFWVYYLRPLGR